MISIHRGFGVVVIDVSSDRKDDASPDGQCYFFEDEEEADRDISYKFESWSCDKGDMLESVFLVCDLDAGSVDVTTGKMLCRCRPKYMVYNDIFPDPGDEGWLVDVPFEEALARASNKYHELFNKDNQE